MREVAALAGVSLKTVSRVVNAEPGVSPDVRQRVERAVLQLGYRHNLGASNLRRTNAHTNTVGALLQDVSNSFSASLLRSLEDTAHARGVAILASSLDEEPDRERSLVANLVRRRVDGLVLMPATDRQDYLSEDLQSGLPVVFVDRRPQGIDADSVTADNVLGSRLAVHHLVAQGHSRIAFLGDLPTIQTAADRYRGFVDGLSDRSLVLEMDLAMGGLRTSDAAQQALLHVLDGARPPTAVFAARNSLAVGAVRALRQRGLSHRVALVGFDDFPLADVLEPGLTVVRQNVGHIGREVSRALFARIDGDQSPPRHVVVTPELVVRGSGEISPAA
ncbi:LacI family DNA-binding transcriptional regulator [Nostocoides sp. HKS02]|nr:LacI family DNA-binding transcriptional regulator [Tetrasphaera sp. HKS02]